MKISELVGERFKERPADCVVDSHALTVRGGYIKGVANGIYSLYTPMRRVTRKIEEIIRREMDRIDGQEVLFPVVMPGSLWRESGRYETIGSELVRFKDRQNTEMVLGMTHEEASVQLVRGCAQTYTRYPFMIYQIQTKFRDEPRPRAGLIRVREFTMKDAYSFHTSQEDLEKYYDKCKTAYHRIFALAGVPEVVAVASDSGMMGGKVAHEFMLITPIGEDSIAVCPKCGYAANTEAAPCITEKKSSLPEAALELKDTPHTTTIEQVAKLLDVAVENTCKAVVFQKNADDAYVVVFIRGDLDANDIKVANALGEAIHPAEITAESGLAAGFIGPVGLPEKVTVLFDRSLEGADNLVCGANRADAHYTGLKLSRDCGDISFGDYAKIPQGGICPECGEHSIELTRGIEVGNIFQLGTKYTKSMNMKYVDANGEYQYPIMGCYGIGVGRLAASVCEAHHDDYGPVWPISIAPWQVSLCCLKSSDEPTKAFADTLYEQLQNAGAEVLYDDRDARPGVMFSDADLLGAPIRLVVSPRNLAENCVEMISRDKTVNEKVPLECAVQSCMALIEKMKRDIEEKAPQY